MRSRRWLTLAVPMMVLAACSLPTDERVVPYDRDDLPPAIANTTTTTTTTTSTTLVPDPTNSSPPRSTTTTSSQPPPATTPIDLYYTIGFSEEITKLTRELQEGAPIQQVIAQLESPLADVTGFGLRTAVPTGMVLDVTLERGTATVNLDADTVDRMSDANLGRAIAQLVLTISSFRPVGSGGVGRVRFVSDGEGFAVFVPADGGSSDPGEELAFEDFAMLIASATGPTTTSVTTTSTPTTEPESIDG